MNTQKRNSAKGNSRMEHMCKNYILTLLVTIVMTSLDIVAQTKFSTCFYDCRRNRPIPVAMYAPKTMNANTVPVIFNHGYDGCKKIDSNQDYEYLTEFLSSKGYYVISIQHDLPTDKLLAMDEPFMNSRMPFWKKGVDNIRFVVEEFQKLIPDLDWKSLVLIGHSNGGDMVMLTATEYPDLADKAISLDHRRMIIPRTAQPKIMTLRGCDYPADDGVLPSKSEQKRYNIVVVDLDGIGHSDMCKNGTVEQHDKINELIYHFLND